MANFTDSSFGVNGKEAARQERLDQLKALEGNTPLIEASLLVGCTHYDFYRVVRERLAPLLSTYLNGQGRGMFLNAEFERVMSIIANLWDQLAPVIDRGNFRQIPPKFMLQLLNDEVKAHRMMPDTHSAIMAWLPDMMENFSVPQEVLYLLLDSPIFWQWLRATVLRQQVEQLGMLANGKPGEFTVDQWERSNKIIQQAQMLANTPGQYFEVSTIDEIIADDGNPPEALIENILAVGGLATVSGRAKNYKSWSVLELVIAGAAGQQIWYGMKVTRCIAAYCDLELSKKTRNSRIKKIAQAKDISLDSLRGWLVPISCPTKKLLRHFQPSGSRLAFVEMVLNLLAQRLEQEFQANPEAGVVPRLVILDSLYKIHAGTLDENSASDMTGLYDLIREFGARLKAAVVIVHHFSKGDPGAKMSGDRAAGSRVHRQEPDAYIELVPLQEAKAYRFEADVRDYQGVEPLALRWQHPLLVLAPDLDPSAIQHVGGRRKKGTPEEVLAVLGDRILSRPEWFAAVREAGIDIAIRTFDRRKDELENAGKVVCDREGKYQKAPCQKPIGDCTPENQ